MKSFKGYTWRYLYKELKPSEELVKKYGFLLAQLLVNRGLESPPNEAKVRLTAESVPNLKEATELVLSYKDKPVFIFGDYDVDGLTSTAVFYKLLKQLGFKKLFPFVPERREGYGITPPFVELFHKYSNGKGGLIIALDNGTKEIETVRYAKSLGFEVVIFDHHTPGEELPEAIVVNPKISPQAPEYLKNLSTVGLAYLFARYLKGLGFAVEPSEFLELAALGTVADVSPLTEINAKIVKQGLERLKSGESSSLGLKILLQKLSLKSLNENDIAFKLAPRLNAFGRMEKARRGLAFLLTEREDLARKLLLEMEELNRKRKRITEEATKRVLEVFEKRPSKGLVYISQSIPKGVLGIVAGRITSTLGVPSVILSTDGEKAVGSSRSPEGVNIVKILEKLSDLMERWGGHAQAAGLSLKYEKLQEFKERFQEEVEKFEVKPPELRIDFELPPKVLKEKPKFVEVLKRLEPFGEGNPFPLFLFEDRLLDFKKTRYGYQLTFEKNGKVYMNTESNKEILPDFYKGQKVRAVYTVKNLDRVEYYVEDLSIL